MEDFAVSNVNRKIYMRRGVVSYANKFLVNRTRTIIKLQSTTWFAIILLLLIPFNNLL